MKPFCAAIVLFFAAPGIAVASSSLVARDLPARSGVVAEAPAAFDLVGMHWRGTGPARLPTQRPRGTGGGGHPPAPAAGPPGPENAGGEGGAGPATPHA